MIYKCDNPGCVFTTKHLTAIKSHKRFCLLRPGISMKLSDEQGSVSNKAPESLPTTCTKTTPDDICPSDAGNASENIVFHDYQYVPQPGLLRNEECEGEKEERVDGDDVLFEEKERDCSRTMQSVAVHFCLIEKKCGKAVVDELINVLRQDDFDKEDFVTNIRTVRDCKGICRSILKKNMSAMHFEEVVVQTGDRKFSTKIYMRNVVEVLKKQLVHADEKCFYFQPVKKVNQDGQQCFGHFMETEFSRKLGEEQRKRIMSNDSVDVIWRRRDEDGCDSFVGYLQLYSDKSKTSLKRTGISAYPVHICLMNFTKDGWKETIMGDRTLVAYLPVGVEMEEDIWRMTGVDSSKTSIPRLVKAELLHRAFELIFEPLSDVTQSGFHCTDKGGKSHYCHPILGEVAVDCPEQKDLLCLLHGPKTKKPCIRCECVNVNMNDGSQYNPRNIQITREVRKAVDQLGEQLKSVRVNRKKGGSSCRVGERVKELLGSESMLACKSFFEHAPFIINNATCNVYELFGFEPMHVMDLGISKEMKKCIYRRLGSEQITVKNGSMKGRTLKQLRTRILKECNEMLRRIELESHVPGFHVDFSSKDGSNTLNGLFTNEGICGMLEAKNYREVDYVFPFLAAFIDRICGDRKGTVTGLTAVYIDIVQICFERPEWCAWNEDEVSVMEEHIEKFQSLCVRHFGKHQPSNFNTEKFHMLSHLGDDVRRFGDLSMVHAGLYENRHTVFKAEYNRTSRRKGTAVGETIARMEFKEILQAVNQDGESDDVDDEMVTKVGITRKKNGKMVMLEEFCDCLQDVSAELEDLEDVITKKVVESGKKKYSIECMSLLRKLGDQGGFSFLQIVCGNSVNQNGYDLRSALFRRKIYFVKSGVIEGGYFAAKEDVKDGSSFINSVRRTSVRRQRVIACEEYGMTGKETFSFCLLRGQDESGNTIYHVVQVRALFYIEVEGEWLQKACIRYMDVVKPRDAVEELLKCVCLRWSTDDEKDYTSGRNIMDEENPPAPWYDVVLFSRLVSVVQVVRQRYELEKREGNPHWTAWRYCLNRFMAIGSLINTK